MAISWYLMKDDYDDLSEYEEEGFLEILASDVADDVELYPSDLSSHTDIRVIIENKTADTKLQSMNRQALAQIGTFKAGMYIKYKDRFWLIVGLVDDNGVYEKGVLILCQHLLSWVNASGNIIQRWANVTSASQYNNGETAQSYYFYLRSDQLMVLVPDDEESLMLETPTRFIIDRRCSIYEQKMEDGVTVSTDYHVLTYELTRADTVLYCYQDSGHSEFIATQDEQHENDGYYVVDGQGYWLCDQIETDSTDEESEDTLTSEILSDELYVYPGMGETTFVAAFHDENGDMVDDVTPTWTIDADFADSLIVEYGDNSISISLDDTKLLNKSFTLTLTADGYKDSTVTIIIKSF